MTWICKYCRGVVKTEKKPSECDNCGGQMRQFNRRDDFDDSVEEYRLRTDDPAYPGFLAFADQRDAFLDGVIVPRTCRWCRDPLIWEGDMVVCGGGCDLPHPLLTIDESLLPEEE